MHAQSFICFLPNSVFTLIACGDCTNKTPIPVHSNEVSLSKSQPLEALCYHCHWFHPSAQKELCTAGHLSNVTCGISGVNSSSICRGGGLTTPTAPAPSRFKYCDDTAVHSLVILAQNNLWEHGQEVACTEGWRNPAKQGFWAHGREGPLIC